MSERTDIEPQMTAVVIVIVIALALLGIQSRQESSQFNEVTDSQILETGHRRLVDSLDGDTKFKIDIEAVIRPGRNGGDFGYWAHYQILTAGGEWVRKEHYEE